MGITTHSKNKMKKNGGKVKDYRNWDTNWFIKLSYPAFYS